MAVVDWGRVVAVFNYGSWKDGSMVLKIARYLYRYDTRERKGTVGDSATVARWWVGISEPVACWWEVMGRPSAAKARWWSRGTLPPLVRHLSSSWLVPIPKKVPAPTGGR